MYYDHHQANIDKKKDEGARDQPKQSESSLGRDSGLGMGQRFECTYNCMRKVS